VAHVEGEVSFTVAGLAVTPRPWDKEGNFEKLEYFTRQAVSEGAGVVVTPEGFLDGYVWNDENPQAFSREEYYESGESIDSALMDRVRHLSRELAIYMVVGFAELREDKMYNSAVVISPRGDIVMRYSKTHTADDEPFNTTGDGFPVVDTSLGRWGVLICMDRQLPETSRILAIKGAQLILIPAWGECGEMNDTMMRTRAYENGVHVAFVHPKRCLIVGPDGMVVAQSSGDSDEILKSRIALRPAGANGPIRRRRPELYHELLNGTGDENSPVER